VLLISGPSKDVVFGLAHAAAGFALDIYKLPDLDDEARAKALEKMNAEGAPTTLPELVDRAASEVLLRKMGWYRKNQFFGGLQGFCVLMGMPKGDAAYLTGLIQAKVRRG
jgi:flagellar motility protein MotE (MotC chaperone)